MELYHILHMPLALSDHSVADIFSDLHIPLIFHIQVYPVCNRFFMSKISETVVCIHLYVKLRSHQVLLCNFLTFWLAECSLVLFVSV